MYETCVWTYWEQLALQIFELAISTVTAEVPGKRNIVFQGFLLTENTLVFVAVTSPSSLLGATKIFLQLFKHYHQSEQAKGPHPLTQCSGQIPANTSLCDSARLAERNGTANPGHHNHRALHRSRHAGEGGA